jgi:membrane-bound lytic murein transglycosylase B
MEVIEMRFLSVLLLIFALSACQQASRDTSQAETALEQAKADIAKLEMENETLKKASASEAKAKKVSKPKPPKTHGGLDEYDPEIAYDETAKPTSKLCWQDYCPCDETVTALDRTICRNARGGIEMSDDQWAIGAQARDGKREGDRLSREMDDIISDMRPSRY